MSYCGLDDLLKRFGASELLQRCQCDDLDALAASETLATAITDAAAEIDGYLTQYPLPLAVVPPVLVRVACDITRYYLYQDLDEVKVVGTRYQSAIGLLKQVAKGAAGLGVNGQGAAPVEQTVVASTSAPRLFGRRR